MKRATAEEVDMEGRVGKKLSNRPRKRSFKIIASPAGEALGKKPRRKGG